MENFNFINENIEAINNKASEIARVQIELERKIKAKYNLEKYYELLEKYYDSFPNPNKRKIDTSLSFKQSGNYLLTTWQSSVRQSKKFIFYYKTIIPVNHLIEIVYITGGGSGGTTIPIEQALEIHLNERLKREQKPSIFININNYDNFFHIDSAIRAFAKEIEKINLEKETKVEQELLKLNFYKDYLEEMKDLEI